MDIFECIENDNFEEVKKLVENGANIYKIRNFPFQSKEMLSPEMKEKYILQSEHTLNETVLQLPLTHTILFCQSEDIANYLLDIYERDLKVLNVTNFKKALVAMPEDQSEELLNCCTFTIPSDEKYFEPVLLKKDNLKPPKLAFLSRKLKGKNDQSLKFIRKLEKNGCCSLNENIFYEFTYTQKLSIALRLFTSQFVTEDEKQYVKSEFLNQFFYKCDINEYEHFYKNFEFNRWHIVNISSAKIIEKLKFILKQKMETENCSLEDILQLDCGYSYHHSCMQESVILYEIILNGLHEELNLEFNEDNFYSKHNSATNDFFKSWFLETAKNDEKIKRFFQNHPKLLTKKSHEDLTVLDYAVIHGHPDIIKIIYEMYDDKEIFVDDQARLLKCLKVSNIFELEAEKVTATLKLLLHDNFESFVMAHGSDIIKNHNIIYIMRIYAAMYFYGLPFFKVANIDMFNIFEVTELTYYYAFDPFKKFIKNFDVLDWNIADANGTTLFMKACSLFGNDTEFLKSVIAKQPKVVNKKTFNNSTCLHFVTTAETDEIARIFVEMGVDPQVINDEGLKAIHYASCKPNKVFAYLLQFESDEDLNKQYSDQSQTLLSSIYLPDHMKLLLTRKIDILAPNPEGIPLIISMTSDETAVVCLDYIRENKIDIDINVKDKNGNNVLMRSICTHPMCNAFKQIVTTYKNVLEFKATNCDGKNFADIIMDQRFLFHDIMNIVKEECLTEFVENFNSLENIIPENFLHVIEFLNPNFLINNITTLADDHAYFGRILSKHQTVTDYLTNTPSSLIKLIKICNNEKSIEMLLAKLNPKIFNIISGGENILHAICEKNNQQIIEDFLVFLTVDQIEKFSNQVCDGKKPFDMLSEDLKFLFENVLQYQ